ncbi:hypothetical protein ASG90_06780 [Nocardioides sp. Soil797]|nr:hypothetical protein ASG90_06780 [Nocardioides sp. Soil797]
MAKPTYTDDEMLSGIRAAADGVDGALTVAAYDTWRAQHGGASGIGIIRRFGKWHEACQQAGLDVVVKTTKKPTFSAEAIVEAVAGYLVEPGSRGTYGGYREWAKGRDGVPSGPTVRNHFPKWDELRALALDAARD